MKIETKRVIIREPIIEDFDAIWAMKNDPEASLFTGGVTSLAKEELYQRHVKRCKNLIHEPREYSVTLKETGEYIGYCGFQFCAVFDGIEILFGFLKEHWGKGYGSEAAKSVLRYGIEELGLDEVIAAVNLENIASEKVLTNIGMCYVEVIDYPKEGPVKKYKYLKNNNI